MADQTLYLPMLQGMGTNTLARVNTRVAQPEIDTMAGISRVALDELDLEIMGDGQATAILTSTHKLLNVAIINLTRDNNLIKGNKRRKKSGKENVKTKVQFHLEEFLQDCGKPLTKPSKDKMLQQIKKNLAVLKSCRMSWSERKNKKITEEYNDVAILSSWSIRNSVIEIEFSLDFVNYLVNTYIMPFPKALLTVDERNPSTYILGYKLALDYSINSRKREKNGGNPEQVISVKKLLEACSQTIPSLDVVMDSDYHVIRRIKKPFEDALNSLSYVSWSYLTPEKAKITSQEASELKPYHYMKLNVIYVLNSWSLKI